MELRSCVLPIAALINDGGNVEKTDEEPPDLQQVPKDDAHRPTTPPLTSKRLSHLHLSGGWKAFAKAYLPSIKLHEIAQHTSKQIFLDKYMDTPKCRLSRARMWLRRREHPDGTVEWTIAWNVALVGDQVEYDEASGVANVLKVLRREINIDFENEELLETWTPIKVAYLPTVRVRCKQQTDANRDAYLDTGQIGPDVYYSVITRAPHQFPLNLLETRWC